MRRILSISVGGVIGLIAATALASPPPREVRSMTPNGLLVTPASSMDHSDTGTLRAHTNLRLLFPAGVVAPDAAPSGTLETPASLACLYGLVPKTADCNPTKVTAVPTGGSRAIAVVDAFDDPTARNDLGVFSQQFGLTPVTTDNFKVIYAAGTKPAPDPTGVWEIDASMDIEMAHAFAPNATVILVEAASDSLEDLTAAEKVAAKQVEAAGGGEVSTSWGFYDFSTETSYSKDFTGKNVVFLASSGDFPSETSFPANLPNVIAVGGTAVIRKPNGALVEQIVWPQETAANSFYVPVPRYQKNVKKVHQLVGEYRAVPDVAFHAFPGAWIYDSTPYNGTELDWVAISSTGIGAPAMAGILNSAGSFAASTLDELNNFYHGYSNHQNWTDITIYVCGNDGEYSARHGYDRCAGVGVPRGYGGK